MNSEYLSKSLLIFLLSPLLGQISCCITARVGVSSLIPNLQKRGFVTAVTESLPKLHAVTPVIGDGKLEGVGKDISVLHQDLITPSEFSQRMRAENSKKWNQHLLRENAKQDDLYRTSDLLTHYYHHLKVSLGHDLEGTVEENVLKYHLLEEPPKVTFDQFFSEMRRGESTDPVDLAKDSKAVIFKDWMQRRFPNNGFGGQDYYDINAWSANFFLWRKNIKVPEGGTLSDLHVMSGDKLANKATELGQQVHAQAKITLKLQKPPKPSPENGALDPDPEIVKHENFDPGHQTTPSPENGALDPHPEIIEYENVDHLFDPGHQRFRFLQSRIHSDSDKKSFTSYVLDNGSQNHPPGFRVPPSEVDKFFHEWQIKDVPWKRSLNNFFKFFGIPEYARAWLLKLTRANKHEQVHM